METELRHVETARRMVNGYPIDTDQVIRFVLNGCPVIVFAYSESVFSPQVMTYTADQVGRDLAERQWRLARSTMGDPVEVRKCSQCGYDLTDTMAVDNGVKPLQCVKCHTQGRVPNPRRFFDHDSK